MSTDAHPAAATTAATAAAEWLKLRSVRSTWWFVGGAAAVMLLTTSIEVGRRRPGDGAGADHRHRRPWSTSSSTS